MSIADLLTPPRDSARSYLVLYLRGMMGPECVHVDLGEGKRLDEMLAKYERTRDVRDYCVALRQPDGGTCRVMLSDIISVDRVDTR